MELLARNRSFKTYIISSGFNFFGKSFISIVLPIVLFTITGNIYSTAILMLCRFLPMFLSNFLVTRINDYGFSPINILKFTSLIRLAAYPLFLLATTQWHYYILTIIIYFAVAISNAYRHTVIKNTCEENDLSQANNLTSFIENIIMLAAPLLGGWLYSYTGLVPLVVIASVCFVVSFILLCKVEYTPKNDAKDEHFEEEDKAPKISFFSGIICIAKKYPLAFLLVVVDTIASISFGSLNSLMPIITQVQYANNASFYSYMNTALALGLVVGNVVFHRRFLKANFKKTYIISTVFATLFFMALGIAGGIIPFLALLFFIGLCNSIQDSSLVTEIQLRMKSANDTSFIFSVYQSFLALTIIICTAVVPATINSFGTFVLFISLGILNILGLLLLLKRKTEEASNL